MAILVISSNTVASKLSTDKRPGLKLAEALQQAGIFTLFDVPSYFYRNSTFGNLIIIFSYLRIALQIIRPSREEIFFYNAPVAYSLLYWFALFSRLRRPSLLLADGVNCYGMKWNPLLFLRMYRRVITLPMNHDIANILSKSSNFIWLPGICNVGGFTRNNLIVDNKAIKLLYNSALLANNGPEVILDFAIKNDWCEVVVTETEDNFLNYLSSELKRTEILIPTNLQFLGVLSSVEYLQLLNVVDGILLCRDERHFQNKFNFPSKFVEALHLGLPVISLFAISYVPSILYHNCASVNLSSLNFPDILHQHGSDEFKEERNYFLGLCDTLRLQTWLKLA